MNRTFVATLISVTQKQSKSYAKPQACTNLFSLMSLQPNAGQPVMNCRKPGIQNPHRPRVLFASGLVLGKPKRACPFQMK